MPLPAFLIPVLVKLGAAALAGVSAWLVSRGQHAEAAAVGSVSAVVFSESKPLVRGRRKKP